MKDIGDRFKEKREEIGISMEEAAEDLGITMAQLDNLEDGNANAFKDIYFLKELVSKYAKYLNIDEDSVMEEYNDFIFNFTSRIPVKEIEAKMKEQKQSDFEEIKSKKINSPYTRKKAVKKKLNIIYLYLAIVLIIAVLLVFVIKALLMRG